ncbi:AAA family ATPase [Pseudomonas mercuritolerans]|uniref:ATP-binding protein n=1 Tax=Pseudomonas mercuritolerans TaxID=2951809 RepID=A0ABT2XPH1_9PSED|nr:ATP-binding protein [Pseudomonas mercuritolerans]MCV2220597.1 ATP-binding protein [Pseudomonas mercuritolerans]
MLVSFSVENFRSFSKEQTFSLVASGRLSGTHDSHTVAIPNSELRVLKVGVLYGANGAGKSSLFKALSYMKKMVLRAGKPHGTLREPYKFSKLRDEPSTFDLQFICEGELYRYGFKVDDSQILEEWLLQVSGKKEVIIYERVTDAAGGVKIEPAGLGKSEKAYLLAKIGGPANQTFLATANATLKDSDLSGHVKNVIHWFKYKLRLTGPDENIEPVGHMLADNVAFREFAGEFLRASSTGVQSLGVEKKEITEQDLEKIIPKSVLPTLLRRLEDSDEGIGIVQMANGEELLLERGDGNRFYQLSVHSNHQVGDEVNSRLPLTEESDGTRRLLQLLPALHVARSKDATYFIDEIDRSMHPMLIWKFLETFLNACDEKNSQIIVTTHESNLLDLELLRRDEIWFAEKDFSLSTNLYSLSDFKVRKDLEVRKHYLQGRFGAVPFLGRLDGLIDSGEEACH